MTTEEINIMFPASYSGNAQISDLRLALSRLVNEGNVGGGDSELERIDEGNGPGWRILGRDPTRYANIGEGAVDLSYSGTHGTDNGASGKYSFAEGFRTSAAGLYSHAGGYNTSARGSYSHAEGDRTYAPGSYSHAEGDRTRATGAGSHAEGSMTSAYGNRSHAEGSGSRANGNNSHAEGSNSIASGEFSHVEGYNSHAEGESSHAEGRRTIALNQASHAAGKYNVGTATDTIHETGIGASNNNRANAFEIYTNGRIRAPELTLALHDDDSSLVTKEYVDTNAGGGSGLEQVTEGGNTGWRLIGMDPDNYADTGDRAVDFSVSSSSGATTHGATSQYSFACGLNTVSDGTASHAEGQNARALGDASHAEGDQCTAEGDASHAEGYYSTAEGGASHAEGYYSTASGETSHAEGYQTTASGETSHAEGYYSTAEGDASHAEGYKTIASGETSHAEGYYSTAEGDASHAEGYKTIASGINGAHAEGSSTTASGKASHAEGDSTEASGMYSHAEGIGTTALNIGSHAQGKFNIGTATDTIHETGIGSDALTRKNAFEIYTDGTLTAPEATPAEITARGVKAIPTIEWLLSAEFGNSLPTANTGVPGELYNDLGTVKVSTTP